MQKLILAAAMVAAGVFLPAFPVVAEQSVPVVEPCTGSTCSNLTPTSLLDDCSVSFERGLDGVMYRKTDCSNDSDD